MTFTIHSKKYGEFKVIIDDADAEKALKHKWHISKHKKQKAVYARRNIIRNGIHTETTLHAFLTGFKITDHINGNGLDCRRANMRAATAAQNVRNVGIRKDNATGYKGVSWDKVANKWVVRIQKDKKNKTVGRYTTKEEAATAYNDAAIRYHGEFAKLNEIGD